MNFSTNSIQFWRVAIASVSAVAAIAAGPAAAATTTVSAIDNPNGAVSVAAGDTLVVTGPVVSTGDSASTRFDKTGAGTLVLQGDNSFKRIKHSAGTLVFDGGATTVSGGSGTGVANDEMNLVFVGDETKFTGGATFSLGSGNGYVGFFSKATTIENATVDATGFSGELLANFRNKFVNKGEGVLTIGEGGVLKAKSIRPHQNSATSASDASASKYGMRIVDGGVLELAGENTVGLVLENGPAGFVLFDGGVLRDSRTKNTYFPNRINGGNTQTATTVQNYWKNTPLQIGENGATVENAASKILRLYVPFQSAAENDGGLHLKGKSLLYIDSNASTYNGGLYLDSTEGQLVAPEYDGALGAVPSEPKDAIFVRGSSTVLFADTDLSLAPTRNVRISSGITFNAAPKNGKTLVIGGEVNGESAEGALPMTTIFKPSYRWTPVGGTWKGGKVVLDSGDGRTSSVGRLSVEGNLEIKSGNVVACAPANGTAANAPIYVYGTDAAADDGICGVLTISGGKLEIADDSVGRYFEVDKRGMVDVCGGELDTNGGEYLNALSSYGLTVIRDGGVLDTGSGNFRVAQTVTDGSVVVRLATNGVLRCNQLRLDTSKRPVATFLFDGGYLHPTVKNNSFAAAGTHESWDGITFAVGPGGAGFEGEAGNNIWIYRPLESGVAEDEKDGGLMVRGPAGTATVLMVAQHYSGPTTIDTVELQQRGGDNLLPAGTDLVFRNRGILALDKYDSAHTPTAATLGGVSGNGQIKNCSAATFSGVIEPSIGGVLDFFATPTSLAGTFRVVGDETGCGNVNFLKLTDISGLTLSLPDPDALDKHADKDLYKIISGQYSGRMTLAEDWPDDWAVRYRDDAVYISHMDPLILVVR